MAARAFPVGLDPAKIFELSLDLRNFAESITSPPAVPVDSEVSASFVRSILHGRRMRDRFFDSSLFADPAWDMLLDLTAARLEGKKVSVTSLGTAAAVPPTTALRWVSLLADQGILVRTADKDDARRVFIELADEAAARMISYLQAVQAGCEMSI